jgi:hypothetical protein
VAIDDTSSGVAARAFQHEQFQFAFELLPPPPSNTYHFDKEPKTGAQDARVELQSLAQAAERLAARLKALAGS